MDAVILNQLFLAFILLIPLVLIARTVVAGTKYSPILIIVVFGLLMGLLLQQSGIASAGLPEYTVVGLMAKVTVIVLIVAFFVGGQEIWKILRKKHVDIEELVVQSEQEVILGTKRTQLFLIVRSFFILLGIQGAYTILTGNDGGALQNAYPILTYLGIMGAIIIIDPKKQMKSKQTYLLKGATEILGILLILIASLVVSNAIASIIPLPQIFFAMLISAGAGMLLHKWQFGPTMRALLFAGIPLVLAANFLIGGSRILQAFSIDGMTTIMGYGFFGQLFWMFGGIALLIYFAKTNHVRNLAPGMAGSLSHSGLTGACTAEDLGKEAAARAPIMINIPFFGHIFVFTILAYSASQGALLVLPAAIVALAGVIITAFSLKKIREAKGEEAPEITGLMMFCFGWQLAAVFGSFLLQHFGGVEIWNAAMGASSAISHFGLFAAIQGNMFGNGTAELIPFIFAMPFLVHPLVFAMFGKAMENEGKMPIKPVYILALIGLIGTILSFMIL